RFDLEFSLPSSRLSLAFDTKTWPLSSLKFSSKQFPSSSPLEFLHTKTFLFDWDCSGGTSDHANHRAVELCSCLSLSLLFARNKLHVRTVFRLTWPARIEAVGSARACDCVAHARGWVVLLMWCEWAKRRS